MKASMEAFNWDMVSAGTASTRAVTSRFSIIATKAALSIPTRAASKASMAL